MQNREGQDNWNLGSLCAWDVSAILEVRPCDLLRVPPCTAFVDSPEAPRDGAGPETRRWSARPAPSGAAGNGRTLRTLYEGRAVLRCGGYLCAPCVPLCASFVDSPEAPRDGAGPETRRWSARPAPSGAAGSGRTLRTLYEGRAVLRCGGYLCEP